MLVVIDVQNGFLTDYTRQVLPYIHQLLRQDWDHVAATRFTNPDPSPFRTLIGWTRLATLEETALDALVEERADTIIDKTTYGAGPQIAHLAHTHQIDEITLVGIDTDVCVLQNAAWLFDHGHLVRADLAGCATTSGAAAEPYAIKLLGRTIGSRQLDHLQP